MDFRDSPEETAWRQEVREFIQRELPTIQDVREAGEDVAARGMAPWQRRGKLAKVGWVAPEYMYVRNAAKTIEAGTSEIQRNIIATRGLGLPRD